MQPSVQGAWLLFQSGRHDLARAAALAVLAEHPEDAEATAMLARATWALLRDEESLQCARRAVGLDPACAFAIDSLARILLDAGRLDESLRVIEEALPSRPDDSGWLGLKAWIETCSGNHAAAIATAQVGLRIDASHDGCLAALARAEYLSENITAARAACESLLRADPHSVFAHRLLGSIAVATHRPAEARARFIDVLRIEPGDERARRAVVVAQRSMSWWGRAFTALSASFVKRRWLWTFGTLLGAVQAHAIGKRLADGVRDESVSTLRGLVALAVATVWGVLVLSPGLALAPALLRRDERRFLAWAERAVAVFSVAPFALMPIALFGILRAHEVPKGRVLAVAFLLLPAAAACAAARVPQRGRRRALLAGAAMTGLGAVIAIAAAMGMGAIGKSLLACAISAALVGPLFIAGMSRALPARRRTKP